MSDREEELTFHLREVLQKTQRERASQKHLDAINIALEQTPDGDPRKRALLTDKHYALISLRHHRRLASNATKLAEEIAYPEAPTIKLHKEVA